VSQGTHSIPAPAAPNGGRRGSDEGTTWRRRLRHKRKRSTSSADGLRSTCRSIPRWRTPSRGLPPVMPSGHGSRTPLRRHRLACWLS
jgi:hypothetical protein